jgi:hypothetical protein
MSAAKQNANNLTFYDWLFEIGLGREDMISLVYNYDSYDSIEYYLAWKGGVDPRDYRLLIATQKIEEKNRLKQKNDKDSR